MKILLYIAHSDPSMAARYREPCALRGIDAEVIPWIAPGIPGVDGGGLSARYDAYAARFPLSPLGRMVADYPPKLPLEQYDAVYLACWSSGYAFARNLSESDHTFLDGLFLIDSGHTSLDKDGTANDAGVAWAVHWADMAREGRKLFWVGHTDVDPIRYASTAKFAAETVRIAGGVEGDFYVEAHNERKGDDMGEHRDSLNRWGPDFVARGIASRMRDKPSLRERLALWAECEEVRGTKEDPAGSNDSVRIREFFSVPTFYRGDEQLKIAKTEWCAAMACYGLHVCGADGFVYRVSGIELENDAKAAGTWSAKPRRGELMIAKRTGGKGEAWQRHVAIVVSVGENGAFTTVGGNENHRVKRTPRTTLNPEILGFVRIEG